jgi:hypothetical protein
MTREEFVKTIKSHVLDIAVSDTIQDLEDPPGRVRTASQVAAQEWYAGLDKTSKDFVEHVARMAAESATFGVLAVLDRVRGVDGSDPGELVLEYRKDGQSVRLNGFDQELLHDLLTGWFDARSRWEKPPLDLHHVPKCSVAMKLIPGYTPENGPCIALPTREHKNIAGEGAISGHSVQDQLDQDIQDLRDSTSVPESSLSKLSDRTRKK